MSEDDWSFIIKWVSVYEAALTPLIIAKIGKQELEDNIARLSIGGANGKIAFCESLGLLDGYHRKLIRAVVELRNRYAHRVSCINMTIHDYYKSLSRDDGRRWLRLLLPDDAALKAMESIEDPNIPRNLLKVLIQWASIGFLAHVNVDIELMKLKTEQDARRLERLRAIERDLEGAPAGLLSGGFMLSGGSLGGPPDVGETGLPGGALGSEGVA